MSTVSTLIEISMVRTLNGKSLTTLFQKKGVGVCSNGGNPPSTLNCLFSNFFQFTGYSDLWDAGSSQINVLNSIRNFFPR